MKHILGDSHYLFTPENPKGPMTYGSNPSIEDTAKFLNDQGEDAQIVDGFYGQPEKSILVRNPKNIKGLHQMSKDFGQESSIFSSGGKHKMFFHHGPNAGKVVQGQGTEFHNEKPRDNYTTIHTPEGAVHFSHNFDFNKSESLNKVQINPSAKEQPAKIRLEEGPNKGRIVDVVEQNTDNFKVKAPPGEANLKVKGPAGPPKTQIKNAGARFGKDKKHKVIQERKPERKGQHVLESKDVHPFMYHTPKQKDLVNGIDLNRIAAQNHAGWTSDWATAGVTTNAKGKRVLVKGRMPWEQIQNSDFGPHYEDLTTAQREGLYHNMAHMLGLGKYVPTTSVVQDNADSNKHGPVGNHYSVMEMIPGAEHYQETDEHKDVLKNLKSSGDLDKLAVMNTLLGNTDRHSANFMISPKGMHLIDHGLTFDFHNDSGRDIYIPDYYKKAHEDEIDPYSADSSDYKEIKMHPKAVEWLKNLDENKLSDFFKKYNVHIDFRKPILGALRGAKKMLQSNNGKVSLMKVLDTMKDHYGNSQYVGSNFADQYEGRGDDHDHSENISEDPPSDSSSK